MSNNPDKLESPEELVFITVTAGYIDNLVKMGIVSSGAPVLMPVKLETAIKIVNARKKQ